jgi:hypothetical protein
MSKLTLVTYKRSTKRKHRSFAFSKILLFTIECHARCLNSCASVRVNIYFRSDGDIDPEKQLSICNIVTLVRHKFLYNNEQIL